MGLFVETKSTPSFTSLEKRLENTRVNKSSDEVAKMVADVRLPIKVFKRPL